MIHGLARRRFLVAASISPVAAAFASRARAAQYSWKFGFSLAANHPLNVRIVEAFEKIAHETDGRLKITSYPNSVLGGYSSMVTQHRLGALEMLAINGGTIDTLVPVAGIDGLAYAFPDANTAFTAMDGDLGQIVRKEMLAKGFFGFERVYVQGFRQFTTGTKPIRDVNDMQGLTLRVGPGKLPFDTFSSLGASLVVVDSGALYAALQTHLVDAQESPLLLIEVQRLQEVQRYCSLSHHMWTSYWITVNAAKWNSLPGTFQEVMRKHINRAALVERRDAEIQEASLRDKLQRQGLTFNAVDVASLKSRLIAKNYYVRWRKEYGPAAWEALTKYSGGFE